jgi:protein-tyrosine phosphatase
MTEQWSRRLELEGVYNLRDIGGYPTVNGQYVRQGVLFRSDGMHKLAATAQKLLLNRNIKTIIDIRTSKETTQTPNVFALSAEVNYLNLPYHNEDFSTQLETVYTLEDGYKLMLEGCKPGIRAIIGEIAANISKGGLIFHCRAGQDRTGLITALLLSLLEVAVDTIVADWVLSLEYLAEPNEAWRKEALAAGLQLHEFDFWLAIKPETMFRTLAYLQEQYGSPFHYLHSIGISTAEVKEIQAHLIEAG